MKKERRERKSCRERKHCNSAVERTKEKIGLTVERAKKKTPLLFPGTSDDGRREGFVEQSRRVNGRSIPSKMEMTQSQ